MTSNLTVSILLSLSFFSSGYALAQDYKSIPIKNEPSRLASIEDVKLLASKVITKLDKWGNYENRSIELTFGLKTIASLCEDLTEIEYLPSQSSLSSPLNPTDFAVKVNTSWKKDCATGADGEPQLIEFKMQFSVDQRDAREAGKTWLAPKFSLKENIRHISFRSGMLSGKVIWSLVKIDYKNLDDVRLTNVKNFSYVQGQVVDQPQ